MTYRRSDNIYIDDMERDTNTTNNANNSINDLIHILDSKVFRATLIITIIVLFYLYH